MAGYTERVDTLMTVLEDCAKSKYKRKIASEAILGSQNIDEWKNNDEVKKRTDSVSRAAKRNLSVCLEFDSNGAPLIQGLVTESIDRSILLENLSINTTIIYIYIYIYIYFDIGYV